MKDPRNGVSPRIYRMSATLLRTFSSANPTLAGKRETYDSGTRVCVPQFEDNSQAPFGYQVKVDRIIRTTTFDKEIPNRWGSRSCFTQASIISLVSQATSTQCRRGCIFSPESWKGHPSKSSRNSFQQGTDMIMNYSIHPVCTIM